MLYATIAAPKLGGPATTSLACPSLCDCTPTNVGIDAQVPLSGPPINHGKGAVLDIISDCATTSRAEEKSCKGCLILRRFGDKVDLVHWSATRLCRVAHRSSMAEILAAADARSNVLYLKALPADISVPSSTELTVDYC